SLPHLRGWLHIEHLSSDGARGTVVRVSGQRSANRSLQVRQSCLKFRGSFDVVELYIQRCVLAVEQIEEVSPIRLIGCDGCLEHCLGLWSQRVAVQADKPLRHTRSHQRFLYFREDGGAAAFIIGLPSCDHGAGLSDLRIVASAIQPWQSERELRHVSVAI